MNLARSDKLYRTNNVDEPVLKNQCCFHRNIRQCKANVKGLLIGNPFFASSILFFSSCVVHITVQDPEKLS
jgi:hypothetical protein